MISQRGTTKATTSGRPASTGLATSVSPVIGRVIKAVQQLRLDSEKQLALEEESSSKIHQLSVQVSALQHAFINLADAVVEELDGLRQESARISREQEQLLHATSQLRPQLAHQPATASVARRPDITASLLAPSAPSAAAAASDSAAIGGLQAGLHELAVQVDGVRAEANEAARAAGAAERHLEELYPQVVQLRGQVALDTATIRQECAQAAGALARDIEAINGDVHALQLLTRQTEESHEGRLAALEGDGEVEALAQRLQAVTAAHARHAKGVEEVMKSLMSDTAAVAKAARTHDARIEGLARAIQMQHEALSRSCAAFAEALNIQTPLSAATSASLVSFLESV